MTLGNLAALQQDNMKRMLAYSSIAQAGYALMGFVLLSNDGIRAMLVYLFAYYLMDAGAFLVVMIVANATGREDIGAYRGLAWRGRRRSGDRAHHLPAFADRDSGDDRLHRQVLCFRRRDPRAVLYPRRDRHTEFGGLALLLHAADQGDVPRAADGDERPFTIEFWNYGLMGVLAIATIVLGLYSPPVIAFASRSLHFFVGRVVTIF